MEMRDKHAQNRKQRHGGTHALRLAYFSRRVCSAPRWTQLFQMQQAGHVTTINQSAPQDLLHPFCSKEVTTSGWKVSQCSFPTAIKIQNYTSGFGRLVSAGVTVAQPPCTLDGRRTAARLAFSSYLYYIDTQFESSQTYFYYFTYSTFVNGLHLTTQKKYPESLF